MGPRFIAELERGKDTAELGKALHVIQQLGLDVWVVPRGVTPGRPTTVHATLSIGPDK
ncbi:MAG TPA: hypothetical protein VGM47_11000 [Gammaproteobacteria bacterium]